VIAYCNGRFVYIRSLESPKVTIYTKHLNRVNAATISPNGQWVASGDDMGQVYVWGTDRPDITKNEIKACRKVNCICWSFDSKRIVAAGDGNPNRAKAFTYDSGNSCGKVDGHTAQIISCDWNGKRPFRLATSGEDMCVAVYDNVPCKYNKEFEGEDHTKYCNSVKYSPDSAFLATAGADGRVFIYDGKKPADKIKKLGGPKKGHKNSSIYTMVWSPDSKMIATGSADRTVKVWDVETKKVIKDFVAGTKGHEFFQVGLVWLEKYLMSVSLNGSLTFWDFDSEKATKRLCGHSAQVMDITLSDGVLYSVGAASRMTKWDMKTGEGTWFEGSGHKEKCINAIGTLKSGKLATVGLDDMLRITDPKGSDWSTEEIPAGGYPEGIATGNTSDICAIFVAQGKVTVVVDGKVTATLAVDYKPCCGAFSMDDKTLVVGDEKAQAHFYDVADGKLKESSFKSAGVHGGDISAAAYSPDGKLVATACKKKKIHIMKTDGEGAPLNSFGWEYHQAAINCMAFSPDSKMLATGSMDESIIIWKDLSEFNAKQRQTIPCHVGGVIQLIWLDNSTIITAGKDKCIKVWKL